MNETITNPRLNYLLNLVNQSQGIKQSELLALISPIYAVSRATILRDLETLIKSGLITKQGQAQTTTYHPFGTASILNPFSLERYFADSADKRAGVRKQFNTSIFSDLHDLVSKSDQTRIENSKKTLSQIEKQLSPQIFKRELERFCVELSWKSSEIEGNTYTLFETETLIKENKSATGKSQFETQMILNHKNAFDIMIENRADFKDISLTTITQLHNLLVDKLDVPTGIRKDPVGITGTTYIPLDNEHQVREMLEKTIELINQTKSPWEKALIAITMIPYIQVFSDGNKRTGRMIGNAILIAHDLFPISYRSVDKEIIKEALIIFYEQNTILPFKQIFIDQLIFAHSTYFRTN
jgi:Fic family protein